MRNLKFFFICSLFFTLSLEAQTLACGKLQETPLPGSSCCDGLKINPTNNLCEDPIKDPTLTYCATDVDCTTALPGQGKGCFRLTEDDFFSGAAQNPNQFTPISDDQDTVDVDRDKNANEDPLPDGSNCVASSDCDSYSCDGLSKKCVEKKICRSGEMGDVVAAGVRCEEGLVVNPQGICDLSEEDKKLIFMGLIEEDVNVKNINKCDLREHQNDPQMKVIRDKSIVSMKTLRAMEWLFSASTLEESQECMKILPFLREEMALKFGADRKKILANFNVEMAKIEKDNQTLQNAKEDSEVIVNIHGEAIKEKDLASRKTSGFDAMKIMWRRNLLFQSYEKAMSEIIKAAATKIGGLAEEMGNWKDKGKKWTVGGKEWTFKTAGKCRGTKGKKIHKRWANYYQVNASSQENAEIVKRPAIADYLSLVSGDAPDAVKSVVTNGPKFTKFSNYFLVDPLMPGVSFDRFGTGKPSKRRLSPNAYPELYKIFRERLVEYYKGLKSSGAPAGFVYEPEIISSEASKCIDKPAESGCEQYTKFIDEMTDIAFAQFLAYSIHSKNSYKKYFPTGSNLRRKLLAKYETDMQNVVKYYDSMSAARDEQTKCLEATINGVVETIIDDGPGVATDTRGVEATGSTGPTSAIGSASLSNSGAGSAAGNTTRGSGVSSSSSGTASQTRNSLRLSQNSRAGFSPNLLSGGLRNLTTGGVVDNLGSSSTVAGGGVPFRGEFTKNFAARFTKMKEVNANARLTGTNFASKSKATESALKNLSSASSSALGSSLAPKVASNGLNGGQAAELEIVPKNLEKEAEADLNRKIVEIKSSQASSSTAAATTSYGPAVSSGTKTDSEVPVISNEDQELIEANYERSRGDYASDEDDKLFNKVSKAYVRNLGKILNKKKKIEE